MSDLNDFLAARSGWTLESARGINDLGQIVGGGERHGQVRAFLLSPRTAQERCFPGTAQCATGRVLDY